MRCAYVCLLFPLWITATSPHAASDLPHISEQFVSVFESSETAREAALNNVLDITGDNFNGQIRLLWSDPAFTQEAEILRQRLIARGLSPERIRLQLERGIFRSQPLAGIEIQIERIQLRLPECTYATQNWRFDASDHPGCALNNALSSSLVNPEKYFF